MSKFLFVHDDDAIDPISQLVSVNPLNAGHCLRLSDFIRINGLHFDNVDGCFHCTAALRPHDTVVVDRVIRISDLTCSNLCGLAGRPSAGQVSHAYSKLLSLYNRVSPVRPLFSTIGTFVPLPTQWRMVAIKDLALQVPRFVYGSATESVDWRTISDPIFKSPFDLYTWQPNEPPSQMVYDPFIVERPSGSLFVTAFCGHQTLSFKPENGASLALTDLPRSTVRGLSAIRDLFSGLMGEVLWFEGSTSWCFAAFSHEMRLAASHPNFSVILKEGLQGPAFI